MTNADAAALAILVFMPIVLMTRALVRRSRGQAFTSDELVTVVGALAITLVAVTLVRGPWVATLLPAALAGFGLLVVVQARAQRTVTTGSMVGLGYAAIAAGILGLVMAVLRTAIG